MEKIPLQLHHPIGKENGPNSGKTALAIFQQYLGSDPIDGPTDSGHLFESTSSSVGNVFMFKAGTASAAAVLDGSNKQYRSAAH
ncbi:hypothetical protein OB236_11495 [Paenibacillus sp. WQ 127069]|uniref:Uncharacterized protein n=1 Tax=Paenibacillus baimaensis TaxID=2982185 RepID=A0ABT2UGE3_9BACL|nr:hypothetical protein [Paenibacillus sp. WQ 127069]MCU6792744.1 hypothetical protein [Paenibacillus sp. WQ 127069]